MAWTKIGENLYMDTSTGAVGELKKNSGGGLFVAGSATKTTRVEKKYKEWEEDLKNGRFAKDRWQKSLDRSSKPESKKAFMSFRDDTQKGIDETKKEMEFYDNPQEYKGDISDLKAKHIAKNTTQRAREIDKLNKEYEERQNKIKSMKPSDRHYDEEKNHLESQQRDLVKRINSLEKENNNIKVKKYPDDVNNKEYISVKKNLDNNDISQMSEYSDTTGTGYSDRQIKAYKDYLQRKHGTTDESIINAGKEKENRVSIEKFANGELPKPTYTKSGKIDFKSFGIERTPESDFSDDGTRFRGYMLPNGMEMTYAKADGDVYLSVRNPYDKEISYKEYSSLPHYNSLDKYNGVRENSVDLNDLVNNSNEYMKEYNQLKKSKGLSIDNRSNYERRLDNFNSAIDSAKRNYEYHEHNNDYSRWRYHRNEAMKSKNNQIKLEEKRNQFIADNSFKNMSFSQLAEMARNYGVKTTGLNQKQLIAKLIAIFNK